MNRFAIRERFGLFDGQLRVPSRPNEKRNGFRKNLWWMLNGETFGYGDLDDEDFIRIQENLSAHEQFMGFNEHHGTQWQQRTNPVVIIRHDSIDFPDPIR